ncbi:MAG: phosphatase domain-containing protein [Candidatus Nanopelagicales bacterium]
MDPRDVPRKLKDSAASKLDDVVRSEETARTVSGWEDRYAAHRRNQKMEDGTLRGIRVVVHRGWAAQGVARIHGRVIESPRLPEEGSRIPYWDVLNANLRRHVSLAFPDVRVRAQLGEATGEGTTDRHGYVSVHLEVPDLTPGWHEVRLTTLSDDDGTEFSGTGRVLYPSPKAKFLVVSDLDDTVIRTGLDEGMVALRRTLFRDAHTRRAVPGMASLYRGLQRGVASRRGVTPPEPGFFYLSTGSWSFYEMLTQFLQLRGYPRGPLFLTDWGPSDRYIHRSGEEHKRQTLVRLREAFPDTPMVLIGDSGQKDPDIYLWFAREHPGAVAQIVIMKASDASAERTAELRDQAVGIRGEGIAFHVADDADEAAQALHAAGLCDDMTLEEVETEIGAVF